MVLDHFKRERKLVNVIWILFIWDLVLGFDEDRYTCGKETKIRTDVKLADSLARVFGKGDVWFCRRVTMACGFRPSLETIGRVADVVYLEL